jgi:hypothetical protein
MKASTLRAWSWAHKWSSLVSTAFLLMLCVTGLPLVFTHEIEHVLLQDSWTPTHPNGPKLNLDQVLNAALARKPGEVPAFMSFDEDRPVVNVTSIKPGDKAGAYSFQPIDQTSGEPAPSVAGHPVMEFLLKLHTDMFLGLPGMLFLGAMGLLLILALVSGVVLYAPFMRRLPFGAVRASKQARTRWLDYHNLLGAVTLAWVLVVGTTGVVNTLATPIIGLLEEHGPEGAYARLRQARARQPAQLASGRRRSRQGRPARHAAAVRRLPRLDLFDRPPLRGVLPRRHASDRAPDHPGPDRRPHRPVGRRRAHALVREDPVAVAAAALRRLWRSGAEDSLGAAGPGHHRDPGLGPLSVAGQAEAGEMKKPGHHFTLWQVFRAPAVIAALSLFGLVAALLGDGLWDVVGALTLASSVAATVWALTVRRR